MITDQVFTYTRGTGTHSERFSFSFYWLLTLQHTRTATCAQHPDIVAAAAPWQSSGYSVIICCKCRKWCCIPRMPMQARWWCFCLSLYVNIWHCFNDRRCSKICLHCVKVSQLVSSGYMQDGGKVHSVCIFFWQDWLWFHAEICSSNVPPPVLCCLLIPAYVLSLFIYRSPSMHIKQGTYWLWWCCLACWLLYCNTSGMLHNFHIAGLLTLWLDVL